MDQLFFLCKKGCLLDRSKFLWFMLEKLQHIPVRKDLLLGVSMVISPLPRAGRPYPADACMPIFDLGLTIADISMLAPVVVFTLILTSTHNIAHDFSPPLARRLDS
eukprot:756021-Hanusia_phi.AAC.8